MSYIDPAALEQTVLKCSEKSKRSENVTPRVLREVTRTRPDTGGGIAGSSAAKRDLLTIISQDLVTLSLRLLSEAHLNMASSSSWMVWVWLAGTTRSMSSAYLNKRLMRSWGCRSDASRTKEHGPSPEPWTILAFMNARMESRLENFVWWQRLVKKLTTQLYTLSGMGKFENFPIIVEWRTVSKALEKSKAIKCTNGFVSNNSEMRWSKHMTAAVVDPVGLYANWSRNRWRVLLCVRTGYKNRRTTTFSKIRESDSLMHLFQKLNPLLLLASIMSSSVMTAPV